jgi:hypothetical protein
MLKGKEANLNVTRSIGGAIVVDNLDSRVIVFIDRSGLLLSVPEFMKNEAKVLRNLGRCIGSNELSFCGALCTYRLSARAVGYYTTSQATAITSRGATLT